MIVVIAGIKRSGSTAMYNIVRLALLEAGYDINICGHNWDARRKEMLSDSEADIIKRHLYSEQIANLSDHIFLTDRDNKGILQSLDRMWNSGNPERIKDMRKHLNKWKQHSHLMLSYDLLNHWPKSYSTSVVLRINLLFDLDINPNVVHDKWQAIELPENQQDPVTLLFPNHIS